MTAKKPELRASLEPAHIKDLDMLKEYFAINENSTVALLCVRTVANQVRKGSDLQKTTP